eukprot:gene16571-22622_t
MIWLTARYWIIIVVPTVLFYQLIQSQTELSQNNHAGDHKQRFTNGAFCEAQESLHHIHPLNLPISWLIPWIWDAVYDPIQQNIELIAISPRSCTFNNTQWKRVYNLFPQYGYQLAYGKEENIFINPNMLDSKYEDIFGLGTISSDKKYKKYQYNNQNRNSIIGTYVTCIFLDQQNNEVFRTFSKLITAHRLWTPISTVHINCPVITDSTNIRWHSIRIERNITYINNNNNNNNNSPSLISTPPVKVCELTPYNNHRKKHELSVCSALMIKDNNKTKNRRKLVEWIEYHLLQGVDHFFIYNTATTVENQHQLKDILKDYNNDGIVTIIDWPYENCAKNMQSGRATQWYESDTVHMSFRPPRAIAQTAALASCYARFRSSSKYITHIDEDEFLFVSLKNNNNNNNNNNNKQRSLVMAKTDVVSSEMIRKIEQGLGTSIDITLKEYINKVFQKNPLLSAICFKAIDMYHCPINDFIFQSDHILNNNKNNNKNNKNKNNHIFMSINKGLSTDGISDSNPIYDMNEKYQLPRLGTWNYGRISYPHHDGKLIVRTDKVETFFVHYVTALTYNNNNNNNNNFKNNSQEYDNYLTIQHSIYKPYLKTAALLHFKSPSYESYDIYGHIIPLQNNEDSFQNYDNKRKQDLFIYYNKMNITQMKRCSEDCQRFLIDKNKENEFLLKRNHKLRASDEFRHHILSNEFKKVLLQKYRARV